MSQIPHIKPNQTKINTFYEHNGNKTYAQWDKIRQDVIVKKYYFFDVIWYDMVMIVVVVIVIVVVIVVEWHIYFYCKKRMITLA